MGLFEKPYDTIPRIREEEVRGQQRPVLYHIRILVFGIRWSELTLSLHLLCSLLIFEDIDYIPI